MPEGRLFVCSTPIGNLEDITLRALNVLRQVDLVCAEDTRHTGRLLEHYGIQVPLLSYHEHNEETRTPEIIERLKSGQEVALVSDAGTPTLADPGFRLVRAAQEAGIPVVPVPGASALLAALAASGLPTDRFVFLGFLPRQERERRELLADWLRLPATLILYEAPHRLRATLADLEEVGADGREAVIARELTKKFESFYRGTVRELARFFQTEEPRGEFVLVLAGGEAETRDQEPGPGGEAAEDEEMRRLALQVRALEESGMARMDAVKAVARGNRLPKRRVYDAVLRADKKPPDQPGARG